MKKKDGKVINITHTVVKLGDACEDILAVHALKWSIANLEYF